MGRGAGCVGMVAAFCGGAWAQVLGKPERPLHKTSVPQNESRFFLYPGHFLVTSVLFKNQCQMELVLNRKTLLVLATKNNY